MYQVEITRPDGSPVTDLATATRVLEDQDMPADMLEADPTFDGAWLTSLPADVARVLEDDGYFSFGSANGKVAAEMP